MSSQRLSSALHKVRRSPSARVLLIVGATALLEFVALDAALASERASLLTRAAVASSFFGLIVAIVMAWWLVGRPFEAAVRENRRMLRSLFVDNPESIAVYGLDGRIVAGNKASADMMKQPADAFIGAHFADFVASELIGEAHAAFRQAAQGGTGVVETIFVGAGGERIDVRTTVFPRVADGRVVGVFGVAKDIGELQRANAAYQEQSQRIGELLNVAASSRQSWRQQVREALSLARRRLGYDGAFLVEIVKDEARILEAVGEGTFEDCAWMQLTVEEQRAVAAGSEIIIDDVSRSAPQAFAATSVRFGEAAVGVLGLSALKARESRLGAEDLDFLRLVAALVASAIQRGRQEERLDQLAFFDALTGLPNRIMVGDRLAELIDSPNWSGKPFAVHYIDLDCFKQVNDGFGHATGDQILCIAARRMKECISESDMVARLGGDEFVVVQPLSDEHPHAEALALRILGAIGEPFCIDHVSHQLGVSIGISISPNNGRDGQTLLQRADEALYRAKREGRNRHQFACEPEPECGQNAFDGAARRRSKRTWGAEARSLESDLMLPSVNSVEKFPIFFGEKFPTYPA